MSTAYFARWSGPVTEADDPYNPSSSTSPLNLPVQKHVQDVYFIPERGGSLDNDNIKWALTTYGGISSYMAWDKRTTMTPTTRTIIMGRIPYTVILSLLLAGMMGSIKTYSAAHQVTRQAMAHLL